MVGRIASHSVDIARHVQKERKQVIRSTNIPTAAFGSGLNECLVQVIERCHLFAMYNAQQSANVRPTSGWVSIDLHGIKQLQLYLLGIPGSEHGDVPSSRGFVAEGPGAHRPIFVR